MLGRLCRLLGDPGGAHFLRPSPPPASRSPLLGGHRRAGRAAAHGGERVRPGPRHPRHRIHHRRRLPLGVGRRSALQIRRAGGLRGPIRVGGLVLPNYRLALIVCAAVAALGLWLLVEQTRLGAMIRAGVDDLADGARDRHSGLARSSPPCSASGRRLPGTGGVLGGPILSVYPGLDCRHAAARAASSSSSAASAACSAPSSAASSSASSTPSAQALLPDLAYVILFLPMVARPDVPPARPFRAAGGVKPGRRPYSG